jgi:AraC family transcriptional regulator
MFPEHKTQTLYKSSLLRVVDYRCQGSANGKLPEEWCAQPEIVLPRSGVYLRHDSDETFVVDPNQVLFFNGGQPYQISHPVAGGDRSTIFILNLAVLLDLLRNLDPSVDDRPDRPFTTNHLTLGTRLRMLQYWLLQSASWSQVEPLEVEEMMLVMLGEVLQASIDPEPKRAGAARAGTYQDHAGLVERVKLLLGQRFQESVRLEEIALGVFSSPYHLCRVFKSKTGMSIHQYLLNVRLAASLERLAEGPEEPLTIVALDLGFASHNHFTSVFRSKFGFSPSEFRRKVRSQKVHELSKILKV